MIAVLTIFPFMWRWNGFSLLMVMLHDQASYTVPLGLNLMKGLYFTDWTGIMSISLVSILPLLPIFVFFAVSFRESPAAI